MKQFSIAFALLIGLSTAPLVLANHHSKQATVTQLKYVELNKIGEPSEVLEVKTEDPRSLDNGEVRVSVLASPIHPSNLLQISGNYGTDAVLPSTPGSEGIGRIVEVSAEVSHLSVGQLVLLSSGGTWRDQIVAPATSFIPLPDLGDPRQQTIEQLSMTAVNPMAALLMLTSFVDLKKGDWLIQNAANSAVGGYLVQLAKLRGIKTVNVVRREGLAKDLMLKGADVVLIDGPDLAKNIAAATNNNSISLAIDAVGGDSFSRLVESLGYQGTLVSYGVMSGKPGTLNPVATIFNDVRIRGFWLSKWYKTASLTDKQAAFSQLIPLIASGALNADIDSRFSVQDIKQAVTRAAQGRRDGKVLIVPNSL